MVCADFATEGTAVDLAKERIDWMCANEDDDILLNAKMLQPLAGDFYEHTVLDMMLAVRGCIYRADTPGRSLLPTSGDNSLLARRYRAAFPSMPGIGSLYPHTVLVGEQPNPRTVNYTRGVPFSAGPSGAWLMSTLGCIDVRSSSYITNAIKHDGDARTVAREIRWLRPAAVVALGIVASGVLDKAKIPHTLAWHPQYARRFHFKEQHEYVEQIRHAIHLGSTERYRYA